MFREALCYCRILREALHDCRKNWAKWLEVAVVCEVAATSGLVPGSLLLGAELRDSLNARSYVKMHLVLPK